MNQTSRIFYDRNGRFDKQLNDFLKENKGYRIRCASYAVQPSGYCDMLFVVFDVCSNCGACGEQFVGEVLSVCPDCGAEMEVQDDTD